MSLRPVPKPIKDTTPAEDEATLQVRGGHGAIKAAVNALRQVGIVSTEPYRNRGDGSVDQKIYFTAYQPAQRYAEQPEAPYVDKSGDIYLMASLDILGKYKLGESIHARQRLGEVIKDYDERFRIIAIHYCSTDRFARETWLKKEVLKWGAKHLERETYWMSDECVQRFISLPNE